MPSYKIRHLTRYTYASTVIDCTNQIMLYPIVDSMLEVRNHEIKISHDPAVESFYDYFGNHVGVFSVIRPHNSLVIESIAEVITKPVSLPGDEMEASAQWDVLKNLSGNIAFFDFLKPESFTGYEEVKNALKRTFEAERTPLQNARAFSEFVYHHFTYQKGITGVETRAEELWKLQAGVCQDFAHMLILLLRMYGIPAKYVSGYICPKDKEMRGEGATHAWVEAYIPNDGWIGLDPTNNCIVNDRHVRLATGRHFRDCTPVKGTYKGSGEHTLEVSVEIKNGIYQTAPGKQELPKFSYQAKNPGEPINSYRYFLEVQQRQQQQQQQQQQQ